MKNIDRARHMELELRRPRIKTRREAMRCLRAIADYMRRRDESPMAAEDIEDAIEVLARTRE